MFGRAPPVLYCCSPVHRQLTNVMQKPEVQLNQNPINYGAWDTCSSAKAVPINTVMRAKREFVTPAWEREALAKLKEEGRDIASIDKDLKVIYVSKYRVTHQVGENLQLMLGQNVTASRGILAKMSARVPSKTVRGL